MNVRMQCTDGGSAIDAATGSGLGWMAAALGSAVIFACVNITDKVVLSRLGLRLAALNFGIGFGQLLIAGVIFAALGIPDVPATAMLGAVAVGVLWGSGLMLMFWVLAREEVSRVAPAFQPYPVFVALAAVFLLDETLTWMKWLAVVLAVGGAMLVSVNPAEAVGRLRLKPTFGLLLVGSLLVAAAQIVLKTVVDDLSIWHVIALRGSGLCIAMALPACRPSVLRELWRFLKTWQGTAAIVGVDTAGAFAANVLFIAAVANGPVSLASATYGTRPLFVFILTALLGWRAAWLLGERLGPRDLALKLTSAVMVVCALVLIAI